MLKYNSNMHDIKAKIETTWIKLILNKLGDPNVHTWGILPCLIKKVVYTLEKHADAGVKKKRFNTYHKELLDHKYEVILLTISMLITNYSKLSVTNLSILLAERVVQLLFTHSN